MQDNDKKERRPKISRNLDGPYNIAYSTSEKMPFCGPSPLVSENNDIIPNASSFKVKEFKELSLYLTVKGLVYRKKPTIHHGHLCLVLHAFMFLCLMMVLSSKSINLSSRSRNGGFLCFLYHLHPHILAVCSY